MKKCLYVLLILVGIFSIATPAFANSAEPPGIIVIATGLPEDAVITLEVPGVEEIEFRRISRSDKLWESYYRLWFHLETTTIENASLRVTAAGSSFTCPLPKDCLCQHNTILTLDYARQTLRLGQYPWRQPLLTALRILLTLLTEGAVFYLFGFREKRSWIAFLLINLLTQGWLNVKLNSYAFDGYWFLAFVFMEAAIFLVEAIAFPLAVREKKPWVRIVYALTANAVSLAAGILMIGHLPV